MLLCGPWCGDGYAVVWAMMCGHREVIRRDIELGEPGEAGDRIWECREGVVVSNERAQRVEVANGVGELSNLVVVYAQHPEAVLKLPETLGQSGEAVVRRVQLLE